MRERDKQRLARREARAKAGLPAPKGGRPPKKKMDLDVVAYVDRARAMLNELHKEQTGKKLRLSRQLVLTYMQTMYEIEMKMVRPDFLDFLLDPASGPQAVQVLYERYLKSLRNQISKARRKTR